MVRKNTKETIRKTALQLFSVHGYDGVSIRDIAKVVGIKESSIYKHYSGKEALLSAIVDYHSHVYEEAAAKFMVPNDDFEQDMRQYLQMEENMLFRLVEQLFLFYVKEDENVWFRHLLENERHHNPELKDRYDSYYVKQPIQYQTMLFQKMMEAGYFVECDPAIMAYQFYAPILVMMELYDEKTEAEIRNLLHRHVYQFGKQYCKK